MSTLALRRLGLGTAPLDGLVETTDDAAAQATLDRACAISTRFRLILDVSTRFGTAAFAALVSTGVSASCG